MKKFLCVCALTSVAMTTLALKKDPDYRLARKIGAQTRFRVHVLDEAGCNVTNADVNVFMGMNFRPKGYWVNGVTDTNGVVVVEGKTCGDEIEIVASKMGYYPSVRKLCFATMGAERAVIGEKWQPFDNEEQMLLRRVRTPLNKNLSGEFVYTQHLNTWIGFDLEVGDYVAPHGAGRTVDFEVSIDWNGKWIPDYEGMGIRIRFDGPYSGYYCMPVCLESAFKGPYDADPKAAYKQAALFYEKKVAYAERIQGLFDRRNCWVVRSRCEVDSLGKLQKANYSLVMSVDFSGKRNGLGGFRIISLFNSTPNDTNLEPKNDSLLRSGR